MLGLRSECAWGKLEHKATGSAVEREKRYFIYSVFNLKVDR